MPAKTTPLDGQAPAEGPMPNTTEANVYAGLEVSVPFNARYAGTCGLCSRQFDLDTPTTTADKVCFVKSAKGRTVVHARCATTFGLPMSNRVNPSVRDLL